MNPCSDTAKRAEDAAKRHAYGKLIPQMGRLNQFDSEREYSFLAGFRAGRADAIKEVLELLREASTDQHDSTGALWAQWLSDRLK